METKPPFRPLSDQKMNRRSWSFDFPNKNSKASQPTPDDLLETMEVQFTPEIIDLADELNNSPFEIYRYVKENIEYQPYYGSLKGAQETLLQGSGNDIDIASLLIALLRSPNVQVPCRYAGSAYANIAVEDILPWLKVNDIDVALDILNDIGISASLVDGNTKVLMPHIWVHAYLPYGNYRGLVMDQTESIWIPLDASIKRHDLVSGLPYADELLFDGTMKTNYYNAIRENHAIDFYSGELQDYLDTNYPGTIVDDVRRTTSISANELEFLPLSLPFQVGYTTVGELSALDDSFRFQVQLQLFCESSIFSDLYNLLCAPVQNPYIDHTLTFPESYAKKITLSFEPATIADQQIIGSYGGFYQTPPNLINVVPVIRVDGLNVATGSVSLMPGLWIHLDVNFLLPGLLLDDTVDHIVNTGGIYALGFHHGGDSEYLISDAYVRLQAVIESGTYEYYSDEYIGELFNMGVLEYFDGLGQASHNLEEVVHHVYNKGLSEVLVGQGVHVEYSGDTPVNLKPHNFFIDVKRHLARYYPSNGDYSRDRELYSLEFMTGSFFEHYVLDNLGRFKGISTVKAFQLAVDQGIPLHEITYADLTPGGELDQLAIDQGVKDAINYAISNDLYGTPQDMIVTVPYDEVTYNQWTGAAWITYDPVVNYETYNLFKDFQTAGGDTTADIPCFNGENCALGIIILWPTVPGLFCTNTNLYAFAHFLDMSTSVTKDPVPIVWTSTIPDAPQGVINNLYVVNMSDQPGEYKVTATVSSSRGSSSDSADATSCEVTFDKDPVEVGISKIGSKKVLGIATATVLPTKIAKEVKFDLFPDNNRVEIYKKSRWGNVYTLKIKGLSPSDPSFPGGDVSIISSLPDNQSCGSIKAVVIVPTKQKRKYSDDFHIKNIAVPYQEKTRIITEIWTDVKITILDQFGDDLHEMYNGKGVVEEIWSQKNVHKEYSELRDGPIKEPSGELEDGIILDRVLFFKEFRGWTPALDSTERQNWVNGILPLQREVCYPEYPAYNHAFGIRGLLDCSNNWYFYCAKQDITVHGNSFLVPAYYRKAKFEKMNWSPSYPEVIPFWANDATTPFSCEECD